MIYRLLTALIFLSYFASNGQGKPVDTGTYKNWERIANYNISNNGEFIYFVQEDGNNGRTILVKSSNGDKVREQKAVNSAQFTSDSKFILYSNPSGLYFVELRTGVEKFLSSNLDFSIPIGGLISWVSYHSGDSILIENLSNHKRFIFESGIYSKFNGKGDVAVVRCKNELFWVDLLTGKRQIIFRGENLGQGSFDLSGKQYAFTVKDSSGGNSLYYVKEGMKQANVLISPLSNSVFPNYNIVGSPNFSQDGKHIFFSIEKNLVERKPDRDLISPAVDIWAYTEKKLKLDFLSLGATDNRKFLASASIDHPKKIVLLESDSVQIVNKPVSGYALVKEILEEDESYYNYSQNPQYRLIDLETGKTVYSFKKLFRDMPEIGFSSSGRYLYRRIVSESRYIIYDLSSRIEYSVAIPFNLQQERMGLRVVRWLTDDQSFLVQTDSDLWQFNAVGGSSINLTNNYGAKHKILFTLASSQVKRDGSIILSGFNTKTKDNGFFKVKTGQSRDPILLGSMYKELYYAPVVMGSKAPVRARDKEIYILTKQTASSSPNLICTSDFVQFNMLSDIHPEKNFNWMTSELHMWKTKQGREVQGILYKPQDLDESKKYPIIFHYYQLRSDELHLFKDPNNTGEAFNIPYYVSNGYLVFVPDIDSERRANGQNAEYVTDVAVSAANYLTENLKYVDSRHMGLQGHSFGGYETNLIIAGTDIFAAAQSSAGPSDLVMGYSTGYGPAINEVGQMNLGAAPWGKGLEVYIKNSPIFNADRIQTPLLIQTGKQDMNVVPAHGVALFVALRRQFKPVWMIRYDESGHTLNDIDALDFSIRQKQFFDHFLRGTPPALWMTGINLKDKGFKSGFQLDSLGKSPLNGSK